MPSFAVLLLALRQIRAKSELYSAILPHSLYCDQVKLEKIEQMYVRVLARYMKALGLEFSFALNTVKNLSTLHTYVSKLDEIEQMSTRTRIRRTR